MLRDLLADLDLKAILQEAEELGRGNDTNLVHATDSELAILRALGGAGTRNPDTGLLEFKDGGQGDGPSGDVSGGGPDTSGGGPDTSTSTSDPHGMGGFGEGAIGGPNPGGGPGHSGGTAGSVGGPGASASSSGNTSTDSDDIGLDPGKVAAVIDAMARGVFGGKSTQHDPQSALSSLHELASVGLGSAAAPNGWNQALADIVGAVVGSIGINGAISALNGQTNMGMLGSLFGASMMNPASVMSAMAGATQLGTTGSMSKGGFGTNTLGPGWSGYAGIALGWGEDTIGFDDDVVDATPDSQENGIGGTGDLGFGGTGTGVASAGPSMSGLGSGTGEGIANSGGRPTSTGWGNALGRGGFISGRSDQTNIFRV